jgi:hypothetical protein
VCTSFGQEANPYSRATSCCAWLSGIPRSRRRAFASLRRRSKDGRSGRTDMANLQLPVSAPAGQGSSPTLAVSSGGIVPAPRTGRARQHEDDCRSGRSPPLSRNRAARHQRFGAR